MGSSEHGMPGKQTQRQGAGRAYGLGFELICTVAGFVLVGAWIDRHYSSGPWGTLVCLGLGLIGGFYNLFRETSRLSGGAGSGAARNVTAVAGNAPAATVQSASGAQHGNPPGLDARPPGEPDDPQR
jgi:F0F1-type ATP synthase assembly protein I